MHGSDVKRSDVGVELVRLLAAEGRRIFSIEEARELAPRVGLKESYLVEALYHLRRTGWIVGLRRGLYALSSAVPGVTPVHEFEIAMALVQPAAVSHWSALHYHGLTQQVPRTVFVLTTTVSPGSRSTSPRGSISRATHRIGDISYRLVQVRPERYFGCEKVWVGETRVTVTDPERTLLDGLMRPHYCGDFAEVLHAFQVRGASLDVRRIVGYALRLGPAAAKRLGWVLERLGIDRSELKPLLDLPMKGYRKLDPTGLQRGRCDRRWMIIENLAGPVAA